MIPVPVLLRINASLSTIDRLPRDQRAWWQRIVRKVGRFWWDRTLRTRFGAYIGKGARISADTKFRHELYGVFIAGTAEIESGCEIFHHVTIGSTRDENGRHVAPKIGKNVFIGANSTLIGRCHIGDGAKIGAGVTLVDAQIPAGSVIINKSAFDLTKGTFVYRQ